MKKYLVFLLAIIQFSCEQNQPKAQNAEEKTTQTHTPKYDFLKWENMKLNGNIPLTTNPGIIRTEIGEADSISAKTDECGMYFWYKDYKKLYVEGLEFEVTSDSAVFRSIDFRNSNNFLMAGKYKLDKNTTTADLQKYFPNSFTAVRQAEVYGVGMLKLIQLNLDDKYTDDMWLMFFDDKKLVRMDYWIGC